MHPWDRQGASQQPVLQSSLQPMASPPKRQNPKVQESKLSQTEKPVEPVGKCFEEEFGTSWYKLRE